MDLTRDGFRPRTLSLTQMRFPLLAYRLSCPVAPLGKGISVHRVLVVSVFVLAMCAVWVSSAVAAGKALQATPVKQSIACSDREITALNGTLFFIGTDGIHGCELWRSDGTSTGTRMLKDVRLGSESSSMQQLTAAGSYVYFTAEDEYHGRELWRTDGTEVGTVMLKDLEPEEGYGTCFRRLFEFKNLLYFFVCDRPDYDHSELWKSDGSSAGTVMVKSNIPANSFWRWTEPAVGVDTIYFATYRPSALWKSDGTAGGTVQIRNFESITEGSASELTLAGGKLFFNQNAAHESGNELWVSEGTSGSTKVVKDIHAGSNGSDPERLTALGASVVFTADDAVHGRELWRSDGTEAGTGLVSDLSPSAEDTRFYAMIAAHGRVYFSAKDGDAARGFWMTDGTAAGTERFPGINSGAVLTSLSKVGPWLVMQGSDTLFTTGAPGAVGPVQAPDPDEAFYLRFGELAVATGFVYVLGNVGSDYIPDGGLVRLDEVTLPALPVAPPASGKKPRTKRAGKCTRLRQHLVATRKIRPAKKRKARVRRIVRRMKAAHCKVGIGKGGRRLTVPVRRNKVFFRSVCKRARPCVARVRIFAGKRTLARGRYAVPAHNSRRVKLRLTKVGRRVLSHKRRVRARLKIVDARTHKHETVPVVLKRR